MVAFARIMVAVDGSEPSIFALERAAQLAHEGGSELTLLMVVPDLPPLAVEEFTPANFPVYFEDLQKAAKEALDRMDEKIKERYPGLRTTPLVMRGNPGKVIVFTAQAREAGLIVVGNRGTGGIASWMLGSVSRQVVESCTVPVLVVKDERFCAAEPGVV
jgi:nucleotide-binding universal stress UspA family protein